MGDGLSQFVLLIVTQQEQCASVEKAQNTQIVQWQRRVGFNLSKSSLIPKKGYFISKYPLLQSNKMQLLNICCSLPSEPGAHKLSDWTKADLDNIFTTNGSKPGWCNVDPAEAYASKVKFKEECDCKYDCTWGRFCETPVLCTCINQCSGHGHCRGGSCQVMFLLFYIIHQSLVSDICFRGKWNFVNNPFVSIGWSREWK